MTFILGQNSFVGLETYACLRFALHYKPLLDEVFRDNQNYQGRGKCYQPKAKAEADNTYRDLDNS